MLNKYRCEKHTTLKAYDCEKCTNILCKRYNALVDFLKIEISNREHICTTNHAVLLENARELLKDMGAYD